MARKHKKLSRKERQAQRRAAIEQVRQERGWQPPPAAQVSSDAGDSELLGDMLPLFPLAEEGPPSPNLMNDLMLALLDSADLIEEPEFAEILVNPMEATATLAQVGEELGLDPEMVQALPAEEQAARQMQMFDLTTRRLLTDELRGELVEALGQLRQRLKESGRRQDVPRVAALESFIGQTEDEEMIADIGLVQAIVRRSLAVGFQLLEASEEMVEEPLEAGESPATLRERIMQSEAASKTEEILKNVPGLGKFIEKQADRTWDEGMEALFTGELYLELFQMEELGAGINIFQEVIGPVEDSEPGAALTKEKITTLINRVDEYIGQIMTPERLEQLRARLEAVLNDKEYQDWFPFLFMLNDVLVADDVLEEDRGLLVQAFMGEVRGVISAVAEEAEEEEAEEEETEEETA